MAVFGGIWGSDTTKKINPINNQIPPNVVLGDIRIYNCLFISFGGICGYLVVFGGSDTTNKIRPMNHQLPPNAVVGDLSI